MRIRTGYSFKTAVGRLGEVATRLKEVGWEKAPITDRLSTYGHVRWKEAAKKEGLTPVYGVEIGVTPLMGEKFPSVDWWTFYATDDLSPLHDLIYLATSQPGLALSYEQAGKAAEDMIAVAGDTADLDATPKRLPLLLSPATPRGQVRKAIAAKRRLVAASANFFPREEDKEMYRVMLGGRLSSSNTYPQWILSDDEWRKALSWIDKKVLDAAIRERDKLLSSCRADLHQATVLVPEKKKTLRQMCVEGAKVKGIDLRTKVYGERLDRELALIELKKFEDYFYIIADMVQWAKEKMVVGPARGSSCGSLVCYLLDITAIDPIPYDLLFERFIDITRADLPDIDLDFSDERREMVFRYTEEKYGIDHVARLGSVSMFQPKSILNQVGKSLRIPSWEIDELANTVVKRSFGDSRADATIEDTLKATEVGEKMSAKYPELLVATRMEFHPHNAGQHAAGVVITQDPVTSVVAIDARTGATMCDKKDAEKLNLLKIDALGLTQLGIFERCLALMAKRKVKGVDKLSRFLEAIPVDDPAAFEILNAMNFSGVFQFGPGSASAGLVAELVANLGQKIDSIEDVVSLTALVRPGPLGSGAANQWLKRRAGQEPVSYFHPTLEPYLNHTLGIVVYQEQVMQIGRNIGDLTWDDVTALRKAMSRSLGKEYFDQYGDRWKAGAARRGWGEERNLFWEQLCQFGMWAFNRSHSVSYAYVSYWCMWLKAHYPLEFAAATLDSEDDPLKQVVMLRELRKEGVGYVAVDPDLSTDHWQVGKGRLIGPLTSIKNIGPAKVKTILDHRKTGKPLPPALAKQLVNCQTEIDSLDPISDAIKRNYPDLKGKLNIHSTPIPISTAYPGRHRGMVVVMGLITKIAPLNENEPTRVSRRGGKVFSGQLEALNFWVTDDSGEEIYCKIDRHKFLGIGRKMLAKAKKGKSLYAVKGEIPRDFRMIKVEQIKFLKNIDGSGEGEDEVAGGASEGGQ